MSEYQAQYTIKKELNFLALMAIKDLTDGKAQDIRKSISKSSKGHEGSSSDSTSKKIEAIRIPLHELEERLEKNREVWDSYGMKTTFADKLSEVLTDLNIIADDSKAVIRFNDSGWYLGKCFDSGLKEAAVQLATSLDFDMAAPLEIEEPEYEKIKIDKKTTMLYEDFKRLAEIMNKGIYEKIGSTTFEQAEWLRGVLEQEERKHQ